MSGETKAPAYEIERRVKGHIKPPEGFELYRRYSHIKDTYVSLEPRIRVRKAVQSYPKVDGEDVEIGVITIKEILEPGSSEVFETETSVGERIGKPEFAIKAFRRFSGLNFVIEGHRESYKKDDIVWCLDYVEGQGEWTEVEQIVSDRTLIPQVSKYIVGLLIENNADKRAIKERDYVDNRMGEFITDFAKLYKRNPLTIQMLEKQLVLKDDSATLRRIVQALKEHGFIMINGEELEFLKNFDLDEF